MALKGVRTVVAETITTFQMQQGTLPSTTRTYIVYPDKFRVDAEINGAQTTQVFNSGAAWVKSPAGIQMPRRRWRPTLPRACGATSSRCSSTPPKDG